MTLEYLLRVANLSAILLLGLFAIDCECEAMPMFARRYNVPCSACHTTPPRLNETGYRFRAAGFRWPEAIGIKETSERFDVLDYMSARIQVRFRSKSSKIGSTKTSNVEGLKLQALELYPFIGSWEKYFSTNTKV